MRWLWTVMLVVGCAHDPAEPLRNPTPKKRPPPPTAPIEPTTRADLSPTAARLAVVADFSIGPQGFSGRDTSEGEKLTRALAKESDAIGMFERLLTQPNRPARLYAYWALRTLDRARADQHRAELETDATKVRSNSGDLVVDLETSRIVTKIDRWPPLTK